MRRTTIPLADRLAVLRSLGQHAMPLAQAAFSGRCAVRGRLTEIPGPWKIRWSVIAGNMRMHRLMDDVVNPGDTFVDVGANIGYNTVYAQALVGPSGLVIAIEPAPDNLEVLQRQLETNAMLGVVVHGVAVGEQSEVRNLYLRGELSAVNSLFPEGCYGPVTEVTPVPVEPLDTLIPGKADVIKIDVEGGELDVLRGATRLLADPAVRLLVEWHPTLQAAAGYGPDALPRWLLERGFALEIAWHTQRAPLLLAQLPQAASYLSTRNQSVELLARRSC
jgi:FkbM family methyltransferase